MQSAISGKLQLLRYFHMTISMATTWFSMAHKFYYKFNVSFKSKNHSSELYCAAVKFKSAGNWCWVLLNGQFVEKPGPHFFRQVSTRLWEDSSDVLISVLLSSFIHFYMGVVALAHEGNESRPNKTRPQLLMARLMQPIPMIFITTPDLACRRKNR